jgi:hypothetical protein
MDQAETLIEDFSDLLNDRAAIAEFLKAHGQGSGSH